MEGCICEDKREKILGGMDDFPLTFFEKKKNLAVRMFLYSDYRQSHFLLLQLNFTDSCLLAWQCLGLAVHCKCMLELATSQL